VIYKKASCGKIRARLRRRAGDFLRGEKGNHI
jgi:hypothetical protein